MYYVFDLLVLAGRDVRGKSLQARRELLERRVLPKLTEPVQYLQELDATLAELPYACERCTPMPLGVLIATSRSRLDVRCLW